MSKSYKKRLYAHRKRLYKKLIIVSAFPLILIAFVAVVFLLGDTPHEWKSEQIVLNSIEKTTVYNGNTGSKTVAGVNDSNGNFYVLSQMKFDEAKTRLKIGQEYEVVYSVEFGRNHIKGIYNGGLEFVSTQDSIDIYKNNKSATIIFCSVCFALTIGLCIITIKFFCKDETKNIKHLKKKIKESSNMPSPAGKGDHLVVDEESIRKHSYDLQI